MFKYAYSMALVCPTEIAGKTSGLGSKLTVVDGTPVPLKPTVCGAPVALLLTVSVAKNGPAAVGAKVTVTSHDPPAGIDPPQPFEAAKSAGFVPLSGVVNVRAVFPMFCKITPCGLLVDPTVCRPNARFVGETDPSVAVAFKPVPKRIAICGEVPVSLSLTDSSPSALPAEFAVKVMLIVQLAPGASPGPVAAGQVFPDIAKLPAGKNDCTVGTIVVNATVLDLFVSVTVIAALVLFTTVFGNCRNVGLRTAICGVPVPLSVTLIGLVVNVPVTCNVAVREPAALGLNTTPITQLVPAAS